MNVTFPWYDSPWLQQYVTVRDLVAANAPERLQEFVAAFEPLRTRLDFEVIKLDQVYDDATLSEINSLVQGFEKLSLNLSEFMSFGRIIRHDEPYFTKLQHDFAERISALVGEEVEPYYNFLSLYSSLGVCEVHMDAPEAKWTFDFCIDQSGSWPIYFSQIVPWPEDLTELGDDWQDHIKSDPALRFTSFTLEPNQAIIFSGSSQWHYRDAIPKSTAENFCHLLFFHYIPKGSRRLINPANWPDLLGMPEIKTVIREPKRRHT